MRECHDGNYNGDFQLVPIKAAPTGLQMLIGPISTPRSGIIDPENPAKSELLTSTLRAHGRGPRPRPIFPGSNDRTYQILAAWANSLRSTKGRDDAKRQDPGAAAVLPEEAFATDRERISRDRAELPSANLRVAGGRTAETPDLPTSNIIPPPLRYRGGLDLGAKPDNLDPRELDFPLPPVIGGFKAALAASKGASKKAAASPAPPTKKASSAAAPAATSHVGASTPKTGASAERGKTPEQVDEEDDADAPKKPTKPVKIDPKLLERMLKRSNGG